MSRVLTCGEALVLLQPVERGRLISVHQFQTRVAGAELNFSIGLARLGIPVGFLGAVGADPFGDLVVRTLAGEGVDTTGVERLPHPTGIFFKEWFGIGPDPNVYYYRHQSAGSLWDPNVEASEALLEEANWFHTSGITFMIGPKSRHSAEALVMACHARGISVSLDLNLRRKLGAPEAWRAVLEPLLSACDVIFASQEELRAVLGTDDPRILVDRGLISEHQALVVKTGQDGAWAFVSDKRFSAPSFPVDTIVDRVGAGDGFAAGVIAARLKGWPWERALSLGNLIGAFAIAHPGDYEGYPTWAEAEWVLEQRWVER